MREKQRAALKAVFPATLPVLIGFLCLGVAYGVLMASKGYGPLWSTLMSAIGFGGSMRFVAITLLVSAFDPLQAFLLALMVNARHIFYGVGLLDKYKGLGRARYFMIFALCDETFSLVSTLEPSGGRGEKGLLLLDHPAGLQLLGGGHRSGRIIGQFYHVRYHRTGFCPDGAVCGAVFGAVEKEGEPARRSHRHRLCRCQPGCVWTGKIGHPRYGFDLSGAAGREEAVMHLTPWQTAAIILAVAAGTQITRWLPFWLFPENKEPPRIVTYLGRVLPAAMMGLLVVYCLKDVT